MICYGLSKEVTEVIKKFQTKLTYVMICYTQQALNNMLVK